MALAAPPQQNHWRGVPEPRFAQTPLIGRRQICPGQPPRAQDLLETLAEFTTRHKFLCSGLAYAAKNAQASVRDLAELSDDTRPFCSPTARVSTIYRCLNINFEVEEPRIVADGLRWGLTGSVPNEESLTEAWAGAGLPFAGTAGVDPVRVA